MTTDRPAPRCEPAPIQTPEELVEAFVDDSRDVTDKLVLMRRLADRIRERDEAVAAWADSGKGASEFTLRQLQEEQKPWVLHNFPGRESFYPLLGAVEELGELAHAHLKMLQGIRGTEEEHRAAAADAVADAVIFLADYCTAMGFDFNDIVRDTWAQVKLRDFQKNKLNGQVTP